MVTGQQVPRKDAQLATRERIGPTSRTESIEGLKQYVVLWATDCRWDRLSCGFISLTPPRYSGLWSCGTIGFNKLFGENVFLRVILTKSSSFSSFRNMCLYEGVNINNDEKSIQFHLLNSLFFIYLLILSVLMPLVCNSLKLRTMFLPSSQCSHYEF